MWNEPDIGNPADTAAIGGHHTPEAIAAFNVRTARIIRRNIPDARIAGLSLATNDPDFNEACYKAFGKDIGLFWPHFFDYARLHPTEHMPRHYQEAAYLYGHLENEVDISRMPFDEQVKRDYQEFMAMAQQYPGMKEEQLRPIMYPRFGKTFYFEYFLIRNQKLY